MIYIIILLACNLLLRIICYGIESKVGSIRFKWYIKKIKDESPLYQIYNHEYTGKLNIGRWYFTNDIMLEDLRSYELILLIFVPFFIDIRRNGYFINESYLLDVNRYLTMFTDEDDLPYIFSINAKRNLN